MGDDAWSREAADERDIARLSEGARKLWAKSGSHDGGWLALPQHLDDASAVAGYLYRVWLPQGTRRTLMGMVGLDDADVERLVRWLAGGHDLGKAEGRFQTQLDGMPGAFPFRSDLEDAGLVVPQGCDAGNVDFISHGAIGERIIAGWLAARGFSEDIASSLAAVAGAHHGVPPSVTRKNEVRALLARYDRTPWPKVWSELLDHAACVADAKALLVPGTIVSFPPGAQLLVTAIVVMADWIASKERYFALVSSGVAAYTARQQSERVARGLARIDLPPAWETGRELPEADAYFAERFPWPSGRGPNDLQRLALDLGARSVGPALAIIEYPMGGGKTEASLGMAEGTVQRRHLGGVFFGTPTMATSDGIFPRVRTWTDRISAQSRRTSMFLAHSHRDLNDTYQELRARSRDSRDAGWGEGVEEQAIVHQWLDGRRQGLLADVVIGTVDQALLMSLLSRHMELRHLALANKVVIIDEVHAYDAYMSQYLERTLEWLAAYGTSVILLSATLPAGTHKNLADAYRRGLGAISYRRGRRTNEVVPPQRAYPGITTVDAAGVQSHGVALPARRNTLRARVIEEDLAVLRNTLTDRLQDGGCAAVICNTVGRAQETYRELRAQFGDDVSLLHAQFIASERARREEKLLSELGPSSTCANGTRPRRRIIVATQVIEQSLDVDFDLIVSDFCPVDLLLQRAGRLHRHERPEGDRPSKLRRPELLIRGVRQAGDEEHIPVFARDFVDTVYRRHSLLAGYAALLPVLIHGKELTLPDDIDPLVQQAYAEPGDCPAAWAEEFSAAAEEAKSYRANQQKRATGYLLGSGNSATAQSLTISDLYFGRPGAIGSDPDESAAGEAQVRDTDPTLEVLLVQRVSDGEVSVLGEYDEKIPSVIVEQEPVQKAAYALARSSIRLPHRFSRPDVFDRTLAQLEKDIHPAWQGNPLLHGQLCVTLNEQGEADLGGYRVRYDSEYGLQVLGTSK